MNEKRKCLGKGFLLKLLVVTGLLLGLFSTISMAISTSTYYIRTGDTLLQVAENHDITLAELMALNPQITNPNNMYVGAAIQVPSDEEEEPEGSSVAQCPQPYTVGQGDTWFTIATAHGVDTGILALVNNMALTDTLSAGTSLCIPAAPATLEVPTTVVMDTDEDMDSDDTDSTVTVTPKIPSTVTVTPKAPPTRLPRPGEGDGNYHIVARGEYLSLIARRYNCTARVLAAVNVIANPSLVYVNTRLWVPSDCASLQPFLPAISVPRYVAPAPAPRPAPAAPQPAPAAPQPAAPLPPPPAPQPSAPAPAPLAPAPQTAAPAQYNAPFNYRSHGPWTGRYFSNIDLQGGPVVTRQDAQIVFDWGTGSPASGVPADRFSVQWTGTFFFTGGNYRFIAMADDGIRVWVDDALIINGWKDQSRTLYYKDYAVRYGNHTVRVEYYDTRLDASAVVNWAQK